MLVAALNLAALVVRLITAQPARQKFYNFKEPGVSLPGFFILLMCLNIREYLFY